MRSSDRLDREIIADRRTPPTTTMSPTLHIKSWHSMLVSFLPVAARNVATVNLNRSSSGAGPEERPPKVLRGAPAGRSWERSQEGTIPLYRSAISSLNALDQPILLSSTWITVGEL